MLQAFGEKCEVARLSQGARKIAAGYETEVYKIWDIKTNTPTLDATPTEATTHISNITCLSIDRDSQQTITGSAEGKVVVLSFGYSWSSTTGWRSSRGSAD